METPLLTVWVAVAPIALSRLSLIEFQHPAQPLVALDWPLAVNDHINRPLCPSILELIDLQRGISP